MAHNDEAGGSGGGHYRGHLRLEEAQFIAEHHIPIPPGMRLPHDWATSAMGYAVPPLPDRPEALRALIRRRRADLSPEQLADPVFALDSPDWPAILAAERQTAIDDHPGRFRPAQWNREWRHDWWGGRNFYGVLREYGFAPRAKHVPWVTSTAPAAARSDSRGSSSSRSAMSTSSSSSRRAPPPAIKKEEPSWSAPPRRTGGVTIRDFGPPAPKTEPASPPWRRQRRGGVAIAAPAPARRELTEEEAQAKYDADIAEAIRRSIDTVQPATVEYAEAWSAAQAGIINVEDDDPPPAAGEVKTEEPEVKAEEPAAEEPAFDWDAHYRTGGGGGYTVKEEDYDVFYRYR